VGQSPDADREPAAAVVPADAPVWRELSGVVAWGAPLVLATDDRRPGSPQAPTATATAASSTATILHITVARS
jgi:hypothetical protein